MKEPLPAPFPLRRLSDVEGQDRAVSLLVSAVASERIPNAWLLTGPRGVGRFTTALATAAAVNCRANDAGGGASGGDSGGGLFGAVPVAAPKKSESVEPRDLPCGSCASCRKVAGGNHPDVRVVRVPPEKRVIAIEAVRDVIAELAFRPYEGRRRVVIVDGAESLTSQASNALLKSLEEPPPLSTFILVADSPSRLLPTVVSRCRIVRFGALPIEVAAKLLAREGQMDLAEARSIASAVGGSVGRALGDERDHFAVEMRAQVLDEMLRVVNTKGAEPIDVAETWDKREKSEDLPVSAALEHLSSWVRDVAVWQASKDPARLLHSDLRDRIVPVATRARPEAIARAYDAVRLCARDIKGNVNDKLALEQMLLELRKELAA